MFLSKISRFFSKSFRFTQPDNNLFSQLETAKLKVHYTNQIHLNLGMHGKYQSLGVIPIYFTNNDYRQY